MSGVVKSKRLHILSSPITPNNKLRAKTLSSSPFYRPNPNKPNAAIKIHTEPLDLDSRTIKKSKII